MFQLAQINGGRKIGSNIKDPVINEFVNHLDSVN